MAIALRQRLPRFEDPLLESEFVAQEDAAGIERARLAAFLAVGTIAVFGLLDTLIVDQDIALVLGLRIALVTAFVAIAVLDHLLYRGRLRGRWWYPALVCTGAALPPLAFSLMSIIAPFPLLYISGGTTVTALAIFALISPRVPIALAIALIVVTLHTVGVMTAEESFGLKLAASAFAVSAAGFGFVAAWVIESLRRRTFLDRIEIAQERARSDRLLHSILPAEIAERLRHDPVAIADSADEVSVVFADIIGSTSLAERLEPTELVGLLNELFSGFDRVCREHGVEKIKTIGDAYMAVAGLVRPDPRHAESAVAVGLGWLHVARRFDAWPGGLQLRVGVHSGPVVAGVIGEDKFAYDLWGDTVNTASRMESHGCAGTVQISEATRRLIGDRFDTAQEIQVEIRGKGPMTTYLLTPADE